MNENVSIVYIPGVPIAGEPVRPELGHWELKISFTFPVILDEITPKWEGDCETDFARRGLERVRPYLDSITGPEGQPFTGYYIHQVIANDYIEGGSGAMMLRRVA